MKRLLAMGMALLLTLPACAEDDEDEWYLIDTVTETVMAQSIAMWSFPVALEDMRPDLVLLVNKSMFLAKDYVPADLVKMKALKLDKQGSNTNGGVRMVDATWQLRQECAAALVALCDAARAEGHELYLKSGYRSYTKQAYMYENRIKKYGYDDGWVTKPGASDHQTGLGCDVVPKKWTSGGMNEKMAQEPETQWMAAHCAEYGFILRYPKDKEDITKINYEPWHLRYVGRAAATYIMDNGLCLEEFHDQLLAAIDDYLANGGQRSRVEGFLQTSAKDNYSRY